MLENLGKRYDFYSLFLKKNHSGRFSNSSLQVKLVRFVGGFARAGSVTAEAYTEATPDPIAGFGPAVAGCRGPVWWGEGESAGRVASWRTCWKYYHSW